MKNNFKVWFILIFNLIFQIVQGQKWDVNWRLGFDCCNTVNGGMNINFESSIPSANAVNFNMGITPTNATISDYEGNLLFYTNGYYIADVTNDTMMNGSGLNPGDFADLYADFGEPIIQGNLILPAPDQSNLYYLFHMIGNFDDPTNNPTYQPLELYYSIIDMSANGGLGAVISKNNILFSDTITLGQLTACKHANGRDWWIVVPKHHSNLYHIALLTPTGFQLSTQSIGTIRNSYNWSGQAVFSPDGHWYCDYDGYNGMTLMNFDRCSGSFYNEIHAPCDSFDTLGVSGGVAFSQNSQFLYVSTPINLFQLNVNSSNLWNSKTLVASYDGYTDPYPTNFYLMFLAFNSKIYLNSTYGTFALHEIQYPDSGGVSCQVAQHSLTLPRQNLNSIPNFPNYSLGREIGSPCDSLLNQENETVLLRGEVFPNPANKKIYFKNFEDENLKVVVRNYNGQILFEDNIHNGSLDVESYPDGFYVIDVLVDNKTSHIKCLVMH